MASATTKMNALPGFSSTLGTKPATSVFSVLTTGGTEIAIAWRGWDLTDELLNNFLSREENTDLLLIAEKWFGSRTGKQKKSLTMRDNRGEVLELSLPQAVPLGPW